MSKTDLRSYSQNGKATALRHAGIILSTIAIFAALFALLEQLPKYQGALYQADVYLPYESSYCPGDVLTFDYELTRVSSGPVQIIRSWCSERTNNCVLDESESVEVNINYPVEKQTVTGRREIPETLPAFAGEIWEYSQSVRRLGTADFDMFIVNFTISEDCN